MGRASTKENKNKYQLIREELGLSREKASKLLETLQHWAARMLANGVIDAKAYHARKIK